MSRSWTRRDFSLDTHMTITVGRGKEHEIQVRIDYSFTPGSPTTPPTYSHGGLPPDPPEVEIQKITAMLGLGPPYAKEGMVELPIWLVDVTNDDDELFEQLCEHASDEEGRGKDD